tara:strand:+ start:2004 stop:2777 length:774 start_codon:yes stop_codon:yes gene_type:complete
MINNLAQYSLFAPFFAIVFGSIFGSVGNMLIYRLPRHLDIVWKPSSCPHCSTSLRWNELIPIFSYMFQKGRCRQCHQPIHYRYLIVELLFVFTSLYVVYPASAFYLDFHFLCVSYCLLILFFTDLETYTLPLSITLFLLLLGLVISHSLLLTWAFIWPFSAFIGGLLLFRLASNAYYKQDTFGLGDIILFAGLALNFSTYIAFLSLYLAIILGGISSVICLALKLKKRKDSIPFAPFIILGFYLSIHLDSQIIAFLL